MKSNRGSITNRGVRVTLKVKEKGNIFPQSIPKLTLTPYTYFNNVRPWRPPHTTIGWLTHIWILDLILDNSDPKRVEIVHFSLKNGQTARYCRNHHVICTPCTIRLYGPNLLWLPNKNMLNKIVSSNFTLISLILTWFIYIVWYLI